MARDKYEISLWEDYMVDANGNIPAHFEERKVVVIGSDTMTAACRAYEPKLVENINGTNTFTFKMFYIYRDEQTGEKRQNPFLNLLVNERKVKVFWKNKWYDLVVKNAQEDSSGKSITYTCKDLFITELSKNGYNLEFDNELENNQGSIIELGKRIVEGTDWKVDEENCEFIKQEKEEPLYIAIVNSDYSISNVHNDTLNTDGPTIGAGETIYIFYSYIQNKGTATSSKIQFLYPQTYTYVITSDVKRSEDGKVYYTKKGDDYIVYTGAKLEGTLYERQYTTDSNSQLIIDEDCYSATINWNILTIGTQPSLQYKGSRLVDSQRCVLDPITDKYVKVYEVKSQPSTRNKGYNYYNKTSDTERQEGVVYYTYTEPDIYTVYNDELRPGVDYYIINPDIIYGYESTEYKDPTFVNNLIVNNKNFARTEGWIGTTNNIVGPFQLYPPYSQTSDITIYNAKSYLKLDVVRNDQRVKIKDGLIYNAGLRESSSYIPNGIQNGEKYVFRVKVMSDNDTPSAPSTPSGTYINSTLTPHIYKYTYHQGNIQIVDDATDYITIEGSWSADGDWRECTCICNTSFSRNQIYNENIGFFVTVSNICWIENVEFFPYVMGEVQLTQEEFNKNKTLYYTRNDDNTYTQCTDLSEYDSNINYYKRINPGEMDATSVATITYHYYNHTTHQGAVELDDYLYVGTTDWPNKSDIKEVSNDFAKVRSITAKQSNRFNLLQTLAETFECWCRFDIKHRGDPGYPITETVDGQIFTYTPGQIVYIDGVPQKFITFKKEVGQETGVGFIYGIDLNSISRTIQSDQIVTKTIVNQNNNEFATNGFCTIARSPENYARDNFILNFDYFISQGLLDGGQVNKDLYSQFNWVDTKGQSKGSKGYYAQLRELNLEFDEITDLLVQKKTELTKQESYKTIYENYITSLQDEKSNLENTIMNLANVTEWGEVEDFVKNNSGWPEIETRMNARENCINNLISYQLMLGVDDDETPEHKPTGLKASIAVLTSIINSKEERKKQLTNDLKELNWAFFRKYSRFIQEGSWIKEDYIDDTLYFLDAQSVAYTSSRPQISYSISVARLSSLEEFKSKVFHLGDISYIQDTEFFGYVVKEGINTPYKEKVLISEVTSNFDDPVQDTFKVQNYKTQFEDLFQRITATTQSLQYASGEYARAAGIVETTGIIKPETLENSIAYNNGLVSQSNNEQIIQDQTGITVVDATNRNKRTKITSGGVFISTDGGANWKNAIRGEGIATQYLTSGNINTQNITLLDGNYQTFRWDSSGINAYSQLIDQQGNLYGINLSKAVRFDHFGVYGINGVSGDTSAYTPRNEKDIWNTAQFGMTWKGFFVKNKYNSHYIEVSSDNDIQVVETNNDGTDKDIRIKIGQLTNLYQSVQIPNTGFKLGITYYIYDNTTQTYIKNIEPYDSNKTYYVDNGTYGILINDGSGNPILVTESDGSLWLKNRLLIGTTESGSYYAGIGYLPLVTDVSKQIIQNGTNLDTRLITSTQDIICRSIDINNKFVVWEDGTMYAKDGYFEGTINATNGVFSGELNGATGTFTGTVQAGSIIASSVHIGGNSGPTMEQVGESVYKVVIDSSQGTIFKNGTIQTTLTARFYEGATEILSGLTYQWKKNNEDISGATSRTLSVDESVDAGNATILYSCVVTL